MSNQENTKPTPKTITINNANYTYLNQQPSSANKSVVNNIIGSKSASILPSESVLQFENHIEPLTVNDSFVNYDRTSPKKIINRANSASGFTSDIMTHNRITSGSASTSELTNFELIDKAITSRKNVTFNKDIDVRIFNKNGKNSKIVDSYVLPLAHQQQHVHVEGSSKFKQDNLYGSDPIYDIKNQNQIMSFLTKSNQLKDINSILEQLNNNSKQTLQINPNNINNLHNFSVSNSPLNPYSPRYNHHSSTNSLNTSSGSGNILENKFTNRANICSSKKFPGETSVKDLEPTLKMIIIKELSVEKVDGK